MRKAPPDSRAEWRGATAAALQRPVSLVVFRLEGQRYAFQTFAVERVLPMVALAPLPKAPAVTLGVINLHGTVIPVLDIRLRFGFPPRDYGITAHLLVARTSRRTLAVPVDEVVGVQEVTVDTVTAPAAVLPGIGHVAGIVALADGLLFIHDLDTFLSLEEERELTTALER